MLARLPSGDLLFRFLPAHAVLFLNRADECVVSARDHVKLLLGKRAPLLPGAHLELLPVAFDAIPVHLLASVFGSRTAAASVRRTDCRDCSAPHVRRRCARALTPTLIRAR